MADILVIGMGISGASMAYHLAHSMPPGTRVILVDARGPAEGATGRNGGHLQPFVHRDFRRDVRDLGLEAALWIRRVEEEGVQEIRELGLGDPVEQGGIVHVWTSEDEKQDALLDLAAAQEAGIAQDLVVLSAQEVNEELKSQGFLGGVRIPKSCQIHPAKLTWALLEVALSKCNDPQTMHLYPYTPIAHLSHTEALDKPGYSTATTEAGYRIRARHVIHTTNAWAGHLLPSLRKWFIPTRSQCVLSSPAPEVPWMGAISGNRGYEYGRRYQGLTGQAPSILLGGGREVMEDAQMGYVDDGALEERVEDRLKDFLHTTLQCPERPLLNRWSGIIALTQDKHPLVGALPKVPQGGQQWISAGFNGHGMTRCFPMARKVIQAIAGTDPTVNFGPWALDGTILRAQRLCKHKES